MNYLDVLVWNATHPILSVVIGLVQFFIVMWAHNHFHNKWLHYALGAWFIPQDFVVNTVAFSIYGREWPQWQDKEWLVTARLKRWKTLTPDSRRTRRQFHTAHKLCTLLGYADMGHC